MQKLRVFSLLFLLSLVACSSSYHVVRMPAREADVFPVAETKAGITVAIDEINNPSRAARYFGVDLMDQGILAVNVIVSNYGEHKASVKPSDVLLLRGKAVIDPLPIQFVAKAAKRDRRLRSRTEAHVDRFFHKIAFKETVLLPNDSYQGVLFFQEHTPTKKKKKKEKDSFFSVVEVFTDGGPKIRVRVTDLDTRQRLSFGPFTISLPAQYSRL